MVAIARLGDVVVLVPVEEVVEVVEKASLRL